MSVTGKRPTEPQLTHSSRHAKRGIRKSASSIARITGLRLVIRQAVVWTANVIQQFPSASTLPTSALIWRRIRRLRCCWSFVKHRRARGNRCRAYGCDACYGYSGGCGMASRDRSWPQRSGSWCYLGRISWQSKIKLSHSLHWRPEYTGNNRRSEKRIYYPTHSMSRQYNQSHHIVRY